MLLETLDIFIGLITVYIILSFVVTSIGELISQKRNLKGKVMLRIVERIMGSTTEAVNFFNHDAMKHLREPSKKGLFNKNKDIVRYPSYVATADFVDAFMDYCLGSGTHGAQLPSAIEKGLEQMDAGKLPCKKHLTKLWQASNYDIAILKQKIGEWFDSTGERSKGWYKRRLHVWLLIAGVVIASFLNADTIRMFKILSEQDSLRTAYAERGTALINNAADKSSENNDYYKVVCKELGIQEDDDKACTGENILKYGLPEILPLVGWDGDTLPEFWSGGSTCIGYRCISLPGQSFFVYWINKILGLLLTACALSLGAPFWFDVLRKIVQIKSAIGSGADKQEADKDKAKTEGTPAAKTVVQKVKYDDDAKPDLSTLTSFQQDKFGFNRVNQFWSARFSSLAYADETHLNAKLEEWLAEGDLVEYHDKEVDAQCLIAKTANACFLSFRGTEQNLTDWLTDARLEHVLLPWNEAAADIKVHKGFSESVDKIWNNLEAKFTEFKLDKSGLPIWISGHSLGGAMAVLAAERIASNHANTLNGLTIGGLHTYGQPRVGNKAFAEHTDKLLTGKYIRTINNRDTVPLVPFPDNPDLLKLVKDRTLKKWTYAHAGRVLYFNDVGLAIMDPPAWYRTLDKGVISKDKEVLINKLKEAFGDHSIENYVALYRDLLGLGNQSIAPTALTA